MQSKKMTGRMRYNIIKGIGLLLLFVTVLVCVSGNAFLYEETVAKIISVENVLSYEEIGLDGETEQYFEQTMGAKILNGSRKGEVITLTNTYSFSGVNDERYRKGNQVFVSLKQNEEEGTITGRKRDVYLVMLIGIFVCLLLYINEWKGMVIFISLVFNIVTFLVALVKYGQGKSLTMLVYGMMFVFSIVTLIFAAGFHKKTIAALLSTWITTALCYLIYEIVVHTCERLPYEMMDYVVNPADLSDLFLMGVLMGSLGAVMDVSISIAAGVAEIVKQTPEITIKALIKSIREMGYDIMGTMINVLFFTYISGAVPVMIIKIKNGYTLYHMIQFELIFEIIRFLMGAIGIVLAIPVAGVCSVLLSGRKEKNRQLPIT